jgi:membrane-bound lytic murein transglycosylase F
MTWSVGPDGQIRGLDHDLLSRFARERGLALRVSFADSAAALLDSVRRGEVQLGAGGLLGPDASPAPPAIAWTRGYEAAKPVVIYNLDGIKPRRWDDLDGATLVYPAHIGLGAMLAAARAAHPRVRFQPTEVVSSDALIAQVSAGALEYAIVPSIDASAARNIHLDFDIAFPAGSGGDFAWAVAPGQPALRAALDAFIARLRDDGTLGRLTERYLAGTQGVKRVDAGAFQDRIRDLLPQWRRTFVEAQTRSGIEWQLLAAVAYQESQWNPLATSETGVRGLMQLTEDTARTLGVSDRLDPHTSAIGAALYIADLKRRLPARIAEPDRTWLALAAFNIGIGHLEDARILARRHGLDPDRWSDVRKMLPLLADPQYYADAKNGYARGGMPVAFVGRVRGYYDILLRTHSAGSPLLQAILAQR